MIEYPKIQSIFKRDEKTHKFMMGDWSMPEFAYLENNEWEFTEKVDGTNIRIEWINFDDAVHFGGRTDNAQIPVSLFDKLNDLFPNEKFKQFYSGQTFILYGEGYGARIQKGGGNYIHDGVNFILFDVLVDKWWLRREDVEDVAKKLGIEVVPIVNKGVLNSGVLLLKGGLKSQWGDFRAEGLVAKPTTQLFDRKGNRIITKLKHKDF